MKVKEKITKAAGNVASAAGKVAGKEVVEKTGKAVYNKKGTIAIVFGALAATALGYWVTKVRGKN